MIARPTTQMPPTLDPSRLMRQASTAKIQNAFQNPPGYLGPPISQPPSSTPLPPQHITPISPSLGTIGAQGDPFQAAPNPDANLMPPTRQPPRTGPTPFPYQVFQNALMQSGRAFTPSAGQGTTPASFPVGVGQGGEGPTLPSDPGLPDPTIPGPHPEMGLDPAGAGYPQPTTVLPLSGSEPPPDGTQDPPDLGGDIGPQPWWDQTPDPSGIGNDPYIPGPGDNTDDIPGGGGRGGTSGGPAPDRVWDAGLGRFVSIYGIPVGQGVHALMNMYRNYHMNNPAGGPGGRGGGNSNSGGGADPGGETAQERAWGDRNFTMAGGNSYYDAPVGESHFNPGTGRYELNRNSTGFLRNFGGEQQITDPNKFGRNPTREAGRNINTNAGHQVADPALRAMLAQWNRDHTSIFQPGMQPQG